MASDGVWEFIESHDASRLVDESLHNTDNPPNATVRGSGRARAAVWLRAASGTQPPCASRHAKRAAPPAACTPRPFPTLVRIRVRSLRRRN